MALTLDERAEIRDAIDGHLRQLHADIARSVGQAVGAASRKQTSAVVTSMATVQESGADTLNNTVDVVYDNDPTNTPVTVQVLGNALPDQRGMVIGIPSGGEYFMGLGIGAPGGGGTPSGALLGSVNNTVSSSATQLTTFGARFAGIDIGAQFLLGVAGGSQVVPTAVTQGAQVGALGFAAYNGSAAYNTVAQIAAGTRETQSATHGGGTLAFLVAPEGTTALQEQMRINNGAVLVGLGATGGTQSLNGVSDLGLGTFFSIPLGSFTITAVPGPFFTPDMVGNQFTMNQFSTGMWPWPPGFAPTIEAVSDDGMTATVFVAATSATTGTQIGSLTSVFGVNSGISGSIFRVGGSQFWGHYATGVRGGDSIWDTVALHLRINHSYQGDGTNSNLNNPGFNADTFIPGPAGLIQIDGTQSYGDNFAPFGADCLASILLNSSRIFQNTVGKDAQAGSFINGLVNTDSFVAQGGNTFSTAQILHVVPNEGLHAWTGSTMQVGKWIGYSGEHQIENYSPTIFGTGIRADIFQSQTVWATPFIPGGRPVTVNMTAGNSIVTATAGSFTSTDVGVGVQAIIAATGQQILMNPNAGIPGGTTLTYIDATHAQLSQAPAITATGVALFVGTQIDTEIGLEYGNTWRRAITFAKGVSGTRVITAYTSGSYATPDTSAFTADDVGALVANIGGYGHMFITSVTLDGPNGLTGSQITVDKTMSTSFTQTLQFDGDWKTPGPWHRRNIVARGAGAFQAYPTGNGLTSEDQHIIFYGPPTPGFFDVSGAYTFNYAQTINGCVVPAYYNASGDARFAQAGSNFGSAAAFKTSVSYEAEPGVNSISLGHLAAFWAQNTYQAAFSTGITTAVDEFWSDPTVTVTGLGSISLSNLRSFRSDLTVGTAATVTRRAGFEVFDATVTGTLTNQYGIYINTLSGAATTNVGIQNEASLVQHGDARFGSAGQCEIDTSGNITGTSMFVQGTFWGIGNSGLIIGKQIDIGDTAFGAQTSSLVLADIASTGTITMNAASITLTGIKYAPTVTYTTNPGAFSAPYIGLSIGATLQGGTGATDTLTGATYTGASITDTIATQDTNARTVSVYDGLTIKPALSVFSGGSLTVTTLNTLFLGGVTVPSGATVTTLTNVLIGAPTITGTLTNWIGIDIPSVTGAGTLNVGLRNKSTTQLGSSAQTVVNGSGLVTSYNAVTTGGMGLTTITDVVQSTAQTAAIGSTNFTNVGTTAGLYRVNYYVVFSTVGTGGSGNIVLTIGWTDVQAARTQTATLAIGNASAFTQGSVYVQLKSANHITYSTTVGTIGTNKYDLYLSVERMN